MLGPIPLINFQLHLNRFYNQESFALISHQVDELLSKLSGVTVTYEPTDLDVSLQVPLNSKEENRYSWTLRICYEVRLKSGLSRIKQVKSSLRNRRIVFILSVKLTTVRFEVIISNPPPPQPPTYLRPI